MNKRVLKTMIFLLWIFLVSFQIVKIFFGEWFAIRISNENILQIGAFIDEHEWLKQGLYVITSWFTYFCYLCACKQKWNLTIKEHLALIIVMAILVVLRKFFPIIGMNIDVVLMVFIPCCMKAEYKQVAIIFTVHSLGQLLLLNIRSLPLLLLGTDFVTQFILSMDAYLWLVLYYLYANKYKEELLWEVFALRFSEISQKMKSKLSLKKSIKTSSSSKRNLENSEPTSPSLKQLSQTDESSNQG